MRNYGQKLQLDHFAKAKEIFEEAEEFARWVKNTTVKNQLYEMAADSRDLELHCKKFVAKYLTE